MKKFEFLKRLLFVPCAVLLFLAQSDDLAATDVYILDNGELGTSSRGKWSVSTRANPYGGNSLYTREMGAEYNFRVDVAKPGEYQVFVRWTQYKYSNTSVPYRITHLGGTSTVKVNQRIGGGKWNRLGTTWNFDTNAIITLISTKGGNPASADAIKLVPVGINLAPVVQHIGNQSVTAGNTLSLNVSATDSDGAAPTLSASGLPTNAIFIDNNNGTGKLSWPTTSLDLGIYNISFIATDTSDPTVTGRQTVAVSVVDGSARNSSSSDGLSNGGPPVAKSSPGVKFYHDFENEVPHVYINQDMKDHWNRTITKNVVSGNIEVVKDPGNAGHGNVMRITYKAGEYGFTKDYSSGSQWRTKVGAHNELYFAYDIYFPENFEFVKGGKLPGLMGGPGVYTGRTVPDGTNGWAGRLMWRADGKVVSYMNTYTYHLVRGAKDVKWDDGPGGQQYFTPGQWHRLEMRYKMNTPGKNNGIHQAWIDGELAVNKTLGYRTKSTVKIDQLLFSTFYGGGDKSWTPVNDNYIYFDNFVVSAQPITH